jgi:hypothetical protein
MRFAFGGHVKGVVVRRGFREKRYV